MPWMEWGASDGDHEIIDLEFQRIMRRLTDTPVRRYLVALDKYGEDDPHTEALRTDAFCYVLEQTAEAQLDLTQLELDHPELLDDQEDE